MISFHIWLFKKIDTYIAKQCSHVEFPYFVCNGFTVVAMKGDYLEFKKCERHNSRKTINQDKDQHENFFWEPP